MKKLLLASLVLGSMAFAQDMSPKYKGAPVDDSSRSAVKHHKAKVKSTKNTVVTEMPAPAKK